MWAPVVYLKVLTNIRWRSNIMKQIKSTDPNDEQLTYTGTNSMKSLLTEKKNNNNPVYVVFNWSRTCYHASRSAKIRQRAASTSVHHTMIFKSAVSCLVWRKTKRCHPQPCLFGSPLRRDDHVIWANRQPIGSHRQPIGGEVSASRAKAITQFSLFTAGGRCRPGIAVLKSIDIRCFIKMYLWVHICYFRKRLRVNNNRYDDV